MKPKEKLQRPNSLALLWNIALKELLNQRKLMSFMVLSLFLGLLSFILIDSFKASLDNHIKGRSKEMMTADVRLFARRNLNESEIAFLEKKFSKQNISERVSFFTMVQNQDADRFTELQIISTNFPLYGEIEFVDFDGNKVSRNEAMQTMNDTASIAVYPEIRHAFSLKENDELQIGFQKFLVRYIVEKDAGAEINFSGLAPKVYIAKNQYDFSQIKGRGNVVRHYVFLRTGDEVSFTREDGNTQTISYDKPKELSKALKDEMKPLLTEFDAPLSVRAHTGSGSQIERILKFITDYLSLVSLIALFLSGIGISYLFRNFVHDKLKETAVLRTLGLTQNKTFLISIAQLAMIGMVSSTLTSIVAYFLVPLVPELFARFLPDNFVMLFSLRSVLITYLVSFAGAIVFCLPILFATKDLSLSYLFTGQIRFYGNPRLPLFLCFLLIVVTFFLTSVWLSNSLEVGSIFTASFFAFFSFLFLIGLGIISSLRFLAGKLPFIFDFSIKSIRHHRFSTIFYFLSISLGVMLITTITQMEKTITNEIQSPEEAVLPTFFLFNIPEKKVETLKQFVSQRGQELRGISPLLGARLTKINGTAIVVTEENINLEDGDSQQWRERDNRRVNVSFRTQQIAGEEILSGKPLTSTDSRTEGIYRVSVAEDYSEERKVKVGDFLTFQMLDVPVEIKAVVHNVRKVKWNTFQPNFWLIFEPEALQSFPKIFLAMISNVKDEEKVALQSAIVKNFPDVSMIDVLKLIEEALGIVNQIGLLVQVMALFSIVLGLFILFSIVNYQVITKWKEINLLKVLGCSYLRINLLVIFEYLTLGLLSLASGIVSGIALSYFFSVAFFENAFSLAGENLIYLSLLICFMIIIISAVAIRKPLQDPANTLLKENAI